MRTVVAILFAWSLSLPSPASQAAQSVRPIRIVLVGDSTVTDDSGWGLGFKQFINETAECVNTAANGRSSKSFIDEGRWRDALERRGDYYLIQFGHNDQPGKGPERETDPATTYPANLSRFVDDVRAIGARPVLVTSLTRRTFDAAGRTIVSTLTPWVEAVKAVSREKNVPIIDLDAGSRKLSEQMGPAALVAFSARTATGEVDTTHLNEAGSLLFGRLVVDELRRRVPALASAFRAEPLPASAVKIVGGRSTTTAGSRTPRGINARSRFQELRRQ